MLTERINAWLFQPDDYQAGLVLLRETGYTGFTLTILEKGADAYNWGRLEAELRKRLGEQTTDLPSVPAAPLVDVVKSEPIQVCFDYGVSETPMLVTQKKTIPGQLPAGVSELYERIYALMNERNEAKAHIRAKEDLGNSAEANAIRRPYAVRVKAITRQIDDFYSQVQFYDQYGYLPPLASDSALVVDDTKALMNIRSYVSRYEGKLRKKNLTSEQRQSAEKLLNQYREEKKRLELKLSNANDTDKTGQQETDRPIHYPTFSGA